MSSEHPRRRFLFWTIAAPAVLGSATRAASPAQEVQSGQQQQQEGDLSQQQNTVRPPAPHDPSSNGNPIGAGRRTDPANASNGGPSPEPDPKEVLKANDKDIKSNVSRLAELAEDLKKQVDATDSTSVLSLTMVHKAEEIEKLAHHIATLTRG